VTTVGFDGIHASADGMELESPVAILAPEFIGAGIGKSFVPLSAT
jgi:thiamine monophosphate synthase